jgi:hypothetical protein
VFLGISGERVGYRDASGMTVPEVGFVFASEISLESLFSLSAIWRRCVCADLLSGVEDDPLVCPIAAFSEPEPRWCSWTRHFSLIAAIAAEGGEVFSSFAAEASGAQAAAGEGHPSGYVKPQGRVGTDAFWYLGSHSSFP